MKKAVGLYTEIIVTIALLTAAALLFSGFLLVNLTQQELVEQRIKSVVETLEAFPSAFSEGVEEYELSADSLSSRHHVLTSLTSKTWVILEVGHPENRAIIEEDRSIHDV